MEKYIMETNLVLGDVSIIVNETNFTIAFVYDISNYIKMRLLIF